MEYCNSFNNTLSMKIWNDVLHILEIRYKDLLESAIFESALQKYEIVITVEQDK